MRDEPASLALLVANATYDDATLRSLAGTAVDVRALREVLEAPDIGGYQVEDCIDQAAHQVRKRIERFFTQAPRDSRLLLYISGHGVKDRDGQLYFTAQDTDSNMLMSSGIAATFIHQVSERSRCRRQIFIFDTCFSGAFARGYVHKSGQKVHPQEPFLDGRGKIVITASNDFQYALVGDTVEGSATASVFTHCLVEGLRTGEAANADGDVTAERLYQYIHDRLRDVLVAQEPQLWYLGMRGDFVVARRPAAATEPLPADLLSLLDHPQAKVRLLGLDELENLLAAPLLRTAVHKALSKRVADSHPAVSRRAAELLKRLPAEALPPPRSLEDEAQAQAEADARREAEAQADAARRQANEARSEKATPPSDTAEPLPSNWRQSPLWPALVPPLAAFVIYAVLSALNRESQDAPTRPASQATASESASAPRDGSAARAQRITRPWPSPTTAPAPAEEASDSTAPPDTGATPIGRRMRPAPTRSTPETAPSSPAVPPPASRAAPRPEGAVPAPDAPSTLQPAESTPLAGHAADVTSIAISPDGQWLASAGNDKKLVLWDVAKGVAVREWTAHGFRITSLAFSPDGRQILSASDERRGNLRLWDTASGRLVRSFDGQNFGLEAAAFSPDGKLVAACGGPKGNVTLWDARTGRAVRTLSVDAYALAFSPNGQTLATAGAGRAISLWDLPSGQAVHRLEGHTDAVRALSFSRDGQLLASAGDDSRVRIWRLSEHRQVQSLPVPWAVAVAFFPDGRRLLAGARIWGGNLPSGPQIWDLATNAPLATLKMGSPTRSIAVAGDGRWVASTDKQWVRVWKMPS